MGILQYSAPLQGATGAVGSGNPLVHCLTAKEQWAFGLLQHAAALSGAVGNGYLIVHCCTVGGSRQWGSFCALPLLLGGSGQWESFGVLTQCRRRWVLCTAALLESSGRRDSVSTLPQCRG